MHSERRRRLVVLALSVYAVSSLISMAVMSIATVLLCLAILVSAGGPAPLWKAIRKKISSHREIRLFGWSSLLLAATCVLSLIGAELWPVSFGGHFATVHFFRDVAKLWYFAWPFVLWHGLSLCSLEERRRILSAWLAAFLILSVVAVIQFFTGWPRPQPIPDLWTHYHATLFLGHHLSVASILIFPFFALLEIEDLPPWLRRLRWPGVALGFVGLALTFSRTLWLALPVGIVLWALLRMKARGRIATVALLLLTCAAAYQIPQIHSRVRNSMGLHEREDLWEANWFFFKQRPITGIGLRVNESMSGYYLMGKYHVEQVFQGHAHNNFIDFLTNTGVLGEASFIAWWAILFWLVIRWRKERRSPLSFASALLAALVVFQINGLTQVNFWEGKAQHQLTWMVSWVFLGL